MRIINILKEKLKNKSEKLIFLCFISLLIINIIFIVDNNFGYFLFDRGPVLLICALYSLMVFLSETDNKNKKLLILGIVISMVLLMLDIYHGHIEGKSQGITRIAYPFIVGITTLPILKDKRILDLSFLVVLIGVIIFSIEAYLLIAGNPIGIDSYIKDSRIYINGIHPNFTGFLFLFGISICLYFVLKNRDIKKRILFILLSLLFYIPLIATKSRKCIIIAIFLYGATYLLDNKNDKKFKKIIYFLILVAFVFGIYILAQNIIDSIFNQVNMSQGTMMHDFLNGGNNRFGIYKSVIKVIKNNPNILLFGTENYREMVSNCYGKVIYNAHNSWLQVAIEYGIFGIIYSLIYTFILIKNIISILTKDNRRNDVLNSYICLMIVCFVVNGLFEAVLFTGTYLCYLNFYFFLLIGYLININGNC